MKLLAEFTIHDLPPTINAIGRKHWAVKHKAANRWKRLVYEQCIFCKIVGMKLQKASLVFTRHSSRECDFDNLASSFKHVLDGLVMAEVIVDDKPSIIGSPTFIWQKVGPKQGKISVQILIDDFAACSANKASGNAHTH